MTSNLICVPPHLVRDVWPLDADRVRAAVLRTDLSHTQYDLLEGDGLLWRAYDCSTIEGPPQRCSSKPTGIWCASSPHLAAKIWTAGCRCSLKSRQRQMGFRTHLDQPQRGPLEF
jgi:hypothetical protein